MAFIDIQDLTVEFCIYGSSARSLKNRIIGSTIGGKLSVARKDMLSIRAIDNISLEVKDGDKIGLIGHNGAGKTTLLRAIAGIYKPTSGKITVRGKVGTLLDITSGMNPEATGYENIYLRGYALGMNKQQINKIADEIIEFTGLEEFIDLPASKYSAGMYARLAFAISTAINPEILLVDEVIGTGDKDFQKKASLRLQSLKDKTRIAFFSSHAEDILKRYCNKILRLQNGKIAVQENI